MGMMYICCVRDLKDDLTLDGEEVKLVVGGK